MFLDKEFGKPLPQMAWAALKKEAADDGALEHDGKKRYSVTAKLAGIPDVLQNPREMPFFPAQKANDHHVYNMENVQDSFTPHPVFISGAEAIEGMYPSPDGTAPKYNRDSSAVKGFLSDESKLQTCAAARFAGAISNLAQWQHHLDEMMKLQTFKPELGGQAPTIRKHLASHL